MYPGVPNFVYKRPSPGGSRLANPKSMSFKYPLLEDHDGCDDCEDFAEGGGDDDDDDDDDMLELAPKSDSDWTSE